MDFRNFVEDMGASYPGDGWTIDRINNNGNYCPENCRWADRKTQARNKRGNVVIEHNGERKTIAEWAELAGLPYGLFYRRLEKGWNLEDALATPVKKHGRRNITSASV